MNAEREAMEAAINFSHEQGERIEHLENALTKSNNENHAMRQRLTMLHEIICGEDPTGRRDAPTQGEKWWGGGRQQPRPAAGG